VAGGLGVGTFSFSTEDDRVPVVDLFGDVVVVNRLVETFTSGGGVALHDGHNHFRTGIELNAGLRQKM